MPPTDDETPAAPGPAGPAPAGTGTGPETGTETQTGTRTETRTETEAGATTDAAAGLARDMPASDTTGPRTDAGLPEVAVVIPAYNATRTLERAIASARAQEGVRVTEIVVVDDASTDGTWDLLGRLARDMAELRPVRNDRNLGPGDTRNRAVAEVTAPWFAVLDADDAMTPGRLARMVGVAEAGGFDALSDLPLYWDAGAGRLATGQLPASGAVRTLGFADLLRRDPATELDLGLMKPLFRTLLRDRGLIVYPPIRHAEDWAMYMGLIEAGARFGLLSEAHYVFTTRIGSDSGEVSPHSVTRVNYHAIAGETRRLAARMAGRPGWDDEAAALSAARIAELRRMNRLWGWTMLRKGEGRRFAQWIGTNPRNIATVAGVAARKLAGHRGRPDW